MPVKNWVPVMGAFDVSPSEILFKGEPTSWRDPADPSSPEKIGYAPGLIMSSQRLNGGALSAEVTFDSIHEFSSCELVFYFDPGRTTFLSAGIAQPAFKIRQWDGKVATTYAEGGDRRNLRAGQPYNLRVTVLGSQIRLFVDEVEVLDAVVPFSIPPSQAGIWCFDDAHVHIKNFNVDGAKGRVFVVMEFGGPFNDIYTEVIKKVAEEKEFDLDVRRADEIYGPGVIVDDIFRDIVESEFIIAEITPRNPNVYYELGFAKAIGKPAIMLVDKGVDRLPFDVASSRVLFYENTISGKGKFEQLLRKHISAILQKSALPAAGGGLTWR